MSGLIRYQSPALAVSSWFDELFSGWDPWEKSLPTTLSPKVDVIEDKDSYKITADIPGIDKKDLKVEVSNGVLLISGEKKEEKYDKDKDRYYHFERSYGSFERQFRLPEEVDPEQVDAKYTNGVLELTLKKSEKAKPKQIEVKIE
jgi:HSP20 family protein